jgi:hypothetical protein
MKNMRLILTAAMVAAALTQTPVLGVTPTLTFSASAPTSGNYTISQASTTGTSGADTNTDIDSTVNPHHYGATQDFTLASN